MMATVPHVTSGLGLRKFQADGFLLTRVYNVNITLWHVCVMFILLRYSSCLIPFQNSTFMMTLMLPAALKHTYVFK